MGINKIASDNVDTIYAAFKVAQTPNRTQRRKYMAQVANRALEWLNKFDATDAAAPLDFAASKQSQYDTFTAAIPDPVLTPVDPTT